MLNLSRERIRKTDADRMSADSGKGTGEPNIENMNLGEAKKFELAILHIDINDFKNKTHTLDNEQYLRLVSTYLTEMTRIVNENEGWIDRYVGDQVTALFGIGHNCSSCNPKACLKCALNMQTIIKYSMNEFLISVGLPTLTCSIGMDYGSIWVAKVGIRGSNEFTLVGNAVNVAANLVEIAPSGTIFLGRSFYDKLPTDEQKFCREEIGYNWTWITEKDKSRYRFYRYCANWTDYPV